MPSPKYLSLFALVTLFTLNTTQAASPSNDWMTDYQQALKIAKKEQKPILLHFHAVWCGPCRSMDQQVLHTAAVKEILGEDVIGVKIDSDKNPAIIRKFGIASLPSDVVIDPDGKVLYRGSGFKSKNNYLQVVTTSAGKYEPQALKMTTRPEATTEPNQDVLLGLEGYSPVVLMKERRWIEGTAEFLSDYKGITYHLQSEEEKVTFESDPERFAPQLLECDPVEMYFADKAVRGSTQYGAYFDGHLYLFQTRDNRETFKKSPLKFTETRHVLKASDIVRR